MTLMRAVRRSLPLVGAVLPCLASSTVLYRIKPDIATSSFSVSIEIENPKADETFQIPGWSPGYYVMEHYDKAISGVAASDGGGKSLTLTKKDDLTFQVASEPKHPIVLTYKVSGNDIGLGFFAASVKTNEAYTNGPASFMYVLGRRTEDVAVHIDHPAMWKVATALNAAGGDNFTASDYDEMADDPIQIGPFIEKKFIVKGIPFRAVFVAPPGEEVRMNPDQQTEMLKKISAPAIDLFGSTPFKQYIYFFHLTGAGFQGGLEHRSGTVIAIPNSNENDLSDLAAHEYFHAWNVKQIRPILLGPFDYTSPQRTGNLWFAEGVTDYYSKILTYRSTVHDLGWLMGELNDQIGTYQGGKTRFKSTVEDSSRAAWENGGFNLGDLDYYNKGLLAGLIFDAKIRSVTQGRKSLDDVMRLMYKKYRLPNPGYSEDGIMLAINEVAGADLSDLYKSMIRSTDELPYSTLEEIGLRVVPPSKASLVALGYPFPTENTDATDLAKYGLQSTDVFLDFADNIDTAEAKVNFLREGVVRKVTLPLADRTFPTWQLLVDPLPQKEQPERFREWTKR